MAYYATKRGGSGCRVIRTAKEAERFLRGNGIREARLEVNGEIIGERWLIDGKWAWSFDQDVFAKCPEPK